MLFAYDHGSNLLTAYNACMALKGKHKWALSGTPIPNGIKGKVYLYQPELLLNINISQSYTPTFVSLAMRA